MRLCALRHGIQISMEAILACHPARSTEWLDWHPKSCELWRIRTGPVDWLPWSKKNCFLPMVRNTWGWSTYNTVCADVAKHTVFRNERKKWSCVRMLEVLSYSSFCPGYLHCPLVRTKCFHNDLTSVHLVPPLFSFLFHYPPPPPHYPDKVGPTFANKHVTLVCQVRYAYGLAAIFLPTWMETWSRGPTRSACHPSATSSRHLSSFLCFSIGLWNNLPASTISQSHSVSSFRSFLHSFYEADKFLLVSNFQS